MFALGIAGLALLGLLVAVRLASANGRDPDAPEPAPAPGARIDLDLDHGRPTDPGEELTVVSEPEWVEDTLVSAADELGRMTDRDHGRSS